DVSVHSAHRNWSIANMSTSGPTTTEPLARFDKNSREEVRVSVDDFQGRKIINLRVWYRDQKDGEMKPGNKGLALSVELYRDLAAAVLKVGEHLQTQGLLPGPK